jgi:hypothetical protein
MEQTSRPDDPHLDISSWSSVEVPGEPFLQGFRVEFDAPFFYGIDIGHVLHLPLTRTYLRFNGVYSEARVWAGGQYIGGHAGGFTSWEIEIPQEMLSSETLRVVIEVTDRADSISAASRYAMHPIGGILREVALVTRPELHFSTLRLDATPALSAPSASSEGVITITAGVSSDSGICRSRITVLDPEGVVVSSADVDASRELFTASLPVVSPSLWTAESPHLYSVIAQLVVDEQVVDTVTQKVGFRRVEVQGTQFLVNGSPVLFRGVNRHDIHPTLGRIGSSYYDRRDVELFKEANVNYVRTSHYPPTEEFLDAADELGLYVEVESAVCFQRESVDDPNRAEEFLGQVEEMVSRDLHRACIVLWSAGNESSWGRNARSSIELIRKLDGSRPVKYSWDHLNMDPDLSLDVFSQHYPGVDEDPGSINPPFFVRPEMFLQARDVDLAAYASSLRKHYLGADYLRTRPPRPVLNDEWAHVPVYDLEGMRRDPGRGVEWGKVLASLASAAWRSPSSMGGAIWGGIDESFHGLTGLVGYGPWGILDTWRRRKPEFAAVRAAYSPIEIFLDRARVDGHQLIIPIRNRHDHTNLSQTIFELEIDDETITVPGPDVGPRGHGELVVSTSKMVTGIHSIVSIECRDHHGRIAFSTGRISLAKEVGLKMQSSAGRVGPRVADDGIVQDIGETILRFEPSGLISFAHLGQAAIAGNVELVSTDLPFHGVKLQEPRIVGDGVELRADFDGGSAWARFEADPSGLLVSFEITNPGVLPRPQDGPQEIGLAFTVSTAEHAQWSVGTMVGGVRAQRRLEAPRAGTPSVYREPPLGSWWHDEVDHYLFGTNDSPGRGSRLFRALKRDVEWLEITTSSGSTLTLAPLTDLAFRLENAGGRYRMNDRSPELRYDEHWVALDTIASGPGDFTATRTVASVAGASVNFDFEGQGFRWVGPRPFGGGVARVAIDGNPEGMVDLRSTFTALDSVTLFTAYGLEAGTHTASISVDSDHPGEIGMDYVEILSEPGPELKLLILAEYSSARFRNITESVNDQSPVRHLSSLVGGEFRVSLRGDN